MTLQEQLTAGEPIFKRISDLVGEAKYDEVYEVIRTTPPPIEWVEEFTSLLDEGKQYKTMKIELLEAVACRIFHGWQVSDISDPIINTNKDKIGITIICTIKLHLSDNDTICQLKGIATEVVHNIVLMPLATPKALAMAKKQGLKQLGDLFGLSLSRNMESEDVNLAKPAENTLVIEAIKEINECKSLAELTKIHDLCAKEVQSDPKFTDAVLQQKKILTLTAKKDG